MQSPLKQTIVATSAGVRSRRRVLPVLFLVVIAGLTAPVSAQTLSYWDTGGAAAGVGGSGTWNTTATNFTTNSNGQTGHVAWNNAANPANNVIFNADTSVPAVANSVSFATTANTTTNYNFGTATFNTSYSFHRIVNSAAFATANINGNIVINGASTLTMFRNGALTGWDAKFKNVTGGTLIMQTQNSSLSRMQITGTVSSNINNTDANANGSVGVFGASTSALVTGTITANGSSGGNFFLAAAAGSQLTSSGSLIGTKNIRIAPELSTNNTLVGNTVTTGGTVKLTSNTGNTYNGTMSIQGGTLLVNGTYNSANVVVRNAASPDGGSQVLGGTGRVGTITLNRGGVIAPGDGGIGMLRTNNGALTWNGEASDSSAQMKFALSTVSNSSDKLDLGTGIFTKGTGSFFKFDFLNGGKAGEIYTLLTFGSQSGFNVNNFSYTGLGSGLTGNFVLNSGSLQFAVVPETPTNPPAEVYLPGDANLINVKTAYGVIGNGVADDTAAIQAAVTANLTSHKTLYFPPGEYRISNTIDFRRPDGKYGALITIQGAGRNDTIIRLDNGSFTNPAAPKPMMKMGSIDSTSGGGNRAHGNNVFDLTLHSGQGNSGAIGLDYNGSNQGAVSRVNIISGDGQGVTGLSLASGVGPASFKDIYIYGFNRGIHTELLFYGMSFEHITLENQNVVGFFNNGNTVAVRGLISNNAVTAFHSKAWHATAVLIDSELNRTGGTQPAIRHESGSLTVRNVNNNGYATTIQAPAGQPNLTGAYVSEYIGVSDSNNGPLSLFGDTPAATLNLAIEETPEFNSANPADWVSVGNFGAIPGDNQDDTAAVAAAMQAGKPVVYFPRGTYNFSGAEIEVPEGVRLIAGFSAFANGVNFRFTNHTQPVIVDRLQAHNSNRGLLKLDGAGAVVYKHGSEMEIDMTSGPRLLFLEDVISRPLVIGADDAVYARGLNIEHAGPTPMILNDGGFLWCLFYKTEQGNTVLHSRNGAESEIMAGFFFPAQGVPSGALSPMTRQQVAMIRNENSWLSLSYTHRGSSTASRNYYLHLVDVRGGDALQLIPGDGHRFRSLLFSSPPEADVTLPISADSYVRAGALSTNYGTASTLWVKYSGSSSFHRRALLKIPLSSLSANVTKAELILTVESLGGESATNRPIELKAVSNDAWSETGVTWSNQPALGSTLASFSVSSADVGNELAIDVTNYVNAQRAVDGVASFALVQPTSASALVKFHSREGSSPPKLVISP